MRGAIAALLLASVPAVALACATAGRPSEPIEIADEEALIVWDPARRTEHFVRRASFRTRARDFGFLVPTPTKPTLAEADDDIFDELDVLTRPPVPRAMPARARSEDPAEKSEPREVVRVLERARIADYDVAVLEADDANALAAWLAKNGYESRPALASWLETYVVAKWKLSAFKLASGSPAPPRPNQKPGPLAVPAAAELQSKAVRLSFETDRPFFPYREPEDSRGSSSSGERALRVYFVGPARVRGVIGDGKTDWPGRLEYTGQPDLAKALGKSLWDTTAIPAGAWLQRFVDRSAPRPGVDELYFVEDDRPAARPSRHGAADAGSLVVGGGPLILLGVALAGAVACVVLVVRGRRR